DYPSRRYKTPEEPQPEAPRRSSLRAVHRSDDAGRAPAKGVTQRPRKKALPPKPSAATRRRRAMRTEGRDELARLAGRNAGRAQAALERAAA
ncbi:hypothetical protein NPN14_24000, partial [Vibrio parahaemolyticus]|uniref:hypothetical protein n=1 Tax=Vibrio parahaemolyticus TaxID=670 RepID=UPI002111CF02